MSLPKFQQFQHAFTGYIRNSETNPIPQSAETRRMQVYSHLIYKNIENALLICFPMLRQILKIQKWARLIRTFLAIHRNRSPLFWQIPNEFIEFLQTEWISSTGYPDCVLNLAHYEWTEFMLFTSILMPNWDQIDPDGDLLRQSPVLNPVLANLHYDWPVQRISLHAKIKPVDTYLLVFRDANNHIQSSEINIFTGRLLSLFGNAELTGQVALENIAAESCHPTPEIMIQNGLSVLKDLRSCGALLGVYIEDVSKTQFNCLESPS